MKNFKFVLLFCFALLNKLTWSQTISGKITEANNSPVVGATVILYYPHDTSLAKVAATDDKGEFALEQVKQGDYLLKASMLGFNNQWKKVSSTNTDVQIPVIILSPSAQTLKEVSISGNKPLIEVKADKTVFNVENSINSTGNSAYELLQKSPGVVLDQNDNIFLKGRGGVMVQVDGKETQLSGQDLADLLKSMQAVDVSSIELISNPSSKYDAEGTAGIINIKLKKNKSFGTNGSLSLGYAYGRYSKYNTALSLNHRGKGINAFGNYSNNWGSRQNGIDIYRVQNGVIYDQVSQNLRSGLSHNFKTGVDFIVNPKHSFGLMANGNVGDIDATNKSKTHIRNEEGEELTEILTSNSKNTVDNLNVNVNGNYRFADTLGHEFTMDIDYGHYDNERGSYQPNIYTLPDETTITQANYYRTTTPTVIDIYTAKADYSQNLWRGKLGAGAKYSMVQTDNMYEFYNVNDNIDKLDSTRSNNFIYTENVNAVYINYQRSIKKLEFQVGVRMENTNSEGDLTSITNQKDKNVKKSYTDFFPSAGVTFNMNRKNAFSLIYSSRIDRPNYQELNPFEFKLDELTYRKGNAFLNPQYTDKIELSHTYNYSVTTSVSYSHTRDFFAQIADTTEGTRSFITSRNLASEDVLSVDFSASHQITKWWSVYLNTGIYSLHYEADFGEGKSIDVLVNTFRGYGQNTFNLPLAVTFELSGWFNSPSVWGGSFKTKEQGALDVGFQRKILKDRATVKISFTDVFFTAPWRSENTYSGTPDFASGDWESRQVRINLTYRFGNNQVKALRQRKTGNESEIQRVGGGDQ